MSRISNVLAVIVLAGLARSGQAQTCVVSRDEVLSALANGVNAEELAHKYNGCVAADKPLQSEVISSLSEVITNTGNTYFEAIKSCGYQPQREEANCTVEIRQRWGFGGPICKAAGSHEFLLLCVDLGAGLVPVQMNGVHVQDESWGVSPGWSFSATIQSNAALLALPNDGRTLKARVILSWALPIRSCVAKPIWGNQSDFRIRLDP